MVKITYFCKLKYNRKSFFKFLISVNVGLLNKLNLSKISKYKVNSKNLFPFEKSNSTNSNSSVAGNRSKQLFLEKKYVDKKNIQGHKHSF